MDPGRRTARAPAALAVTAGVLGLLAAAGTGLLALVVQALGRDVGGTDGGAEGPPLLIGAVALLQAAGAVLLLCRRGWLLLAVASLPGTVLLIRLAQQWSEYASPPSVPEYVGAASALVLGLCLSPPVRRWSRPASEATPGPGGGAGKP